MIRAAAAFGVTAGRLPGLTGAWVPHPARGLEKIAAIGVRTANGGAEITKMVGTSAWYAPGSATAEMVEIILKDKKKIEVVNPEQVTMKNGKPATQGVCPVCSTKMFKIGG